MIARYGRLPWLVVGFFIPLSALAQPPSALPTADSLATHWKNLLETDAEKAYVAMRRLASTPKETLAFLRETEKPAAPVEAGVIDELIRQLGSDRFAVREKAVQELERHDRHAMEALKKAAQGPIDLETKRRVDALLARQDGRLSGFAMRWRRTIEIVEWIGTSEAKNLLEYWSRGRTDARLTREAHLSLKCWTPPDVDAAANGTRLDSAGDLLPENAVLRLGDTRWRTDESPIDRGTIQFTPDGRQLLVIDSDAFRIMNVHNGKTARRVPFDGTVDSALLTPDLRRLVATGHARDETGAISPVICVWDWKDAKKLLQWNVEGALLGFAQKGETALLATAMGIRQVDLNTGREIGHYPTPKGVNLRVNTTTHDAATLNGNLIAVPGAKADAFSVYDWTGSGNVRTVRIPGTRISDRNPGLAFSPGNKFLAHAASDMDSADRGVTIFDVATLQPVRHLQPKGSASSSFPSLDSVVFSPDGKSLAFSSANYQSSLGGLDKGAVVIWDLENHKVRAKTRRSAGSLAFSPDSRLIAGRAGSQRILVWDTATGKELTGGEDEPAGSIYHLGLGFFPNGRGIRAPNQEAVGLWDFPSGKLRSILTHRDTRAVAVSPDNSLVSTGSYWDNIRIWDIATGKERFRVPSPGHQNLWGVAFSPNGERVNVWSDDAVLRSWDTKTGRLVSEFNPRFKGFPDIADDNERGQILMELTSNSTFSYNGTQILWSFGGLHLFDVSSGKALESIDVEHGIYQMSTSANSDWLLANDYGDGPKITIINLRERKVFAQMELVSSSLGVAPHGVMSPDGHSFAIAYEQPLRKIDVYETAPMQRRLTISHESGVSQEIAFSPKGRYLAAAHSDGTTLVYDLRGRP